MNFKKGDRVRLTARSIALAWGDGPQPPESSVVGTVVGLNRWGHIEVDFDGGSTQGLRPADIRPLSIVEELARLV